MARGRRGSLLLRRKALSSSSPCRFIPALLRLFWREFTRAAGRERLRRHSLTLERIMFGAAQYGLIVAVDPPRAGAVLSTVRLHRTMWAGTAMAALLAAGWFAVVVTLRDFSAALFLLLPAKEMATLQASLRATSADSPCSSLPLRSVWSCWRPRWPGRSPRSSAGRRRPRRLAVGLPRSRRA